MTPKGIIFEQDPKEDALLPLNVPVNIKVSSGWPVPEFIGQTFSEANRVANDLKISLEQESVDNLAPIGEVIDQKPKPNSLIPPRRIVNVKVSRGYALPDLRGKTEAEARQIASKLKFELKSSRTPLRNRQANQIEEQTPDPGTRLPFSESVEVVISEGWKTPDFLKLSEHEAEVRAREERVGIKIGAYRKNREAQPGIVIDQSPDPDALLPPNQDVQLVLSKGWPTPAFVGLTEPDAMSLANEEGVQLVMEQAPSLDAVAGTVMTQSPDPGEPLPSDNIVTATFSTGWTMPNLIGKTEEEANRILEELRMSLIKDPPQEDFHLDRDLVMAQEPAEGALLPTDHRVTISLSLTWPIAPDAIGQQVNLLEKEFGAQHPNVLFSLNDSFMTLETPGTIIAQQPAKGIKLDTSQRLELTYAAEKPLWFWPLLGLSAFIVIGGGAATMRLSKGPSTDRGCSYDGNATQNNDLSSIRLRVTRDQGIQTVSSKENQRADSADQPDRINIRVRVDMGDQSISPPDQGGNNQ